MGGSGSGHESTDAANSGGFGQLDKGKEDKANNNGGGGGMLDIDSDTKVDADSKKKNRSYSGDDDDSHCGKTNEYDDHFLFFCSSFTWRSGIGPDSTLLSWFFLCTQIDSY